MQFVYCVHFRCKLFDYQTVLIPKGTQLYVHKYIKLIHTAVMFLPILHHLHVLQIFIFISFDIFESNLSRMEMSM